MRGAQGRDHLKPKAPPLRVPWLYGINHSSPLKLASPDTPRLRADCVRPAETCEKSSAELFSVCSGTSQTAIETRIRRCRVNVQYKNKLHCRAHKQIQEFRAARTIRARVCLSYTNTIWLPPGRFSLSSFGRHVCLESENVRKGAFQCLITCPREVYMRVSIAAGGRKTSRRDFFACFS